MQPITVLSLFDWMACWRLALERAGIPVEKYFASEIDKYAIQVAEDNRLDVIEVGDIKELRIKSIDINSTGILRHLNGTSIYVGNTGLDLLIGGSPCQWFSCAGKGLNFEDPRSKLFFEFVRILKEAKPRYFLLENVKMKKEWQNIISEHLFGIQPVEIDSALVSAQSRKRLYWIGRLNDDWTYSKVDISLPKDRWILLWDILEKAVDEKYYLSDKVLERLKSYWYESLIRAAKEDGKAYSITSSQWGHREPKVVLNTNPSLRWMNGDVYVWDKSPTLTTNKWEWIKILQKYEWLKNIYSCIRKLTPIECERLQTLPDDYTAGVSNSQRYKMLGNGWTIDVIAHIFREMFRD